MGLEEMDDGKAYPLSALLKIVPYDVIENIWVRKLEGQPNGRGHISSHLTT